MLELEQKQVLDLFAKNDFFRFFSAEEKAQLLGFKHYLLGFKGGQTIIRQGDKDTALFVLLRGKVFISKRERGTVRINELKPGDIFGDVSFLSHRERTTNVVADGDVSVLKMDWDLMKNLTEVTRNKIKDQLIEVLINRLDDMNKILADNIR